MTWRVGAAAAATSYLRRSATIFFNSQGANYTPLGVAQRARAPETTVSNLYGGGI